MWYRTARPALFALDPEKAHRLALKALQLSGAAPAQRVAASSPVTCFGLRFPNRVGLAAGFDKNAVAVDGLGRLGFGFIEVGTVTPRPQAGQPIPRLFRLPASAALVNRLGFPNEGADAIVARLRRRRYRGIVGVNIGKNADTPLSKAVDDYVSCYRSVRSVADYVTVNVSSPNTSGLRTLQTVDALKPLLSALMEVKREQSAFRPPVLVKISPDLDESQLNGVCEVATSLSVDGIVATNTTLRPQGGLSGAPLFPLALSVVARLRARLGTGFPIIGVGGIDSPQSAVAMRNAGADLIQLYTGLIYRGPGLVHRVVRAVS